MTEITQTISDVNDHLKVAEKEPDVTNDYFEYYNGHFWLTSSILTVMNAILFTSAPIKSMVQLWASFMENIYSGITRYPVAIPAAYALGLAGVTHYMSSNIPSNSLAITNASDPESSIPEQSIDESSSSGRHLEA
ncbi:hypothetical protein [Candidatus Synchoanobacter obligatus]|uniref:Uncharacterized protein n=1 Tax=Candidatus Synchoanobacter obligatus TaxID=2919597 RepID=A0ABT1L692_9GAMM|nr:hypothetical protein [Candidatus Synchoanobacter obligatus]MCP8352667.1 hypothetical protein [Candidatus Synchoanobacter obligatus]